MKKIKEGSEISEEEAKEMGRNLKPGFKLLVFRDNKGKLIYKGVIDVVKFRELYRQILHKEVDIVVDEVTGELNKTKQKK